MLYMAVHNGLLRGFYFNSSAFSANQFEVVVFVLPLYVPIDFIGLTFGYSLKTPSKLQWWNYDEKHLEQLGKELANAFIQAERDFLSRITDAKSFYEYYKKNKKSTPRFFEAVAYSAAYSELAIENDELKELLSYLKKDDKIKLDWMQELHNNTEKLITGDRKSIFNNWEEQNLNVLNL